MFEDPTDISIELSPVGGRKQQVFPLAILWPLSLGVALAVRVPARSPQLLAEACRKYVSSTRPCVFPAS